MKVPGLAAEMACKIFHKHCNLFKALSLNVFEPDVAMLPRHLGSHDLVACPTNLNLPGLVSVELKVGTVMNMKLERDQALQKTEPRRGFQEIAGHLCCHWDGWWALECQAAQS